MSKTKRLIQYWYQKPKAAALSLLGFFIVASLVTGIVGAVNWWSKLTDRSYWKNYERFQPRAKRFADICVRAAGYQPEEWIAEPGMSVETEKYAWRIGYWRAQPQSPAEEQQGDLEVYIDRHGNCYLFEPPKAKIVAEALKSVAEFVANEQLKKSGLNPETMTAFTSVYVEVDGMEWRTEYWRTPPKDPTIGWADYQIYVADGGEVVGVEQLIGGNMKVLYRKGLPRLGSISLYEAPPGWWAQASAPLIHQVQSQLEAYDTAIAKPIGTLNPYRVRADAVLRQHGYDPSKFRAEVWYGTRWTVDYWPIGLPLPTSFVEQPSVVVTLANSLPDSTDLEDKLEVPTQPSKKTKKVFHPRFRWIRPW